LRRLSVIKAPQPFAREVQDAIETAQLHALDVGARVGNVLQERDVLIHRGLDELAHVPGQRTNPTGKRHGPQGRLAADFTPEPGYVSLFNGHDLTGWRFGREVLDGKTETSNRRFQAVDGAIVANVNDINGRGGIQDLSTAREFNRDFHLKLEFRASARSDSGVYLRGQQLQVRDYPAVGPYRGLKGFRDGGWNELDVTVRGGVAVTLVNGKPLTDSDTLELTVKDGRPAARLNGKVIDVSKVEMAVGAAALCKCNGEVLERAFRLPTGGGIGLQAEVGKFEFRRIRIRETP
jgi:hypothetical protein